MKQPQVDLETEQIRWGQVTFDQRTEERKIDSSTRPGVHTDWYLFVSADEPLHLLFPLIDRVLVQPPCHLLGVPHPTRWPSNTA